MAKISSDRTAIEYDSYDEYVDKQNGKAHTKDSKMSLEWNMEVISTLKKLGYTFNRLLDVGCRAAVYFDILNESGIDCVGIDISEKSVKYAQSKGRNVVLGDAVDLTNLVDNFFDVVISCASIEHIQQPLMFLHRAYSILNDNGVIAIRVPEEFVIKNKDNTFSHAWGVTMTKLLDLMQEAHFKIKYVKRIGSNSDYLYVGQK